MKILQIIISTIVSFLFIAGIIFSIWGIIYFLLEIKTTL